MTQPTLYIPHGGGPCFFLNDDGSCPPMWRAMQDYLANLLSGLAERPKAILLVSAHWAEPQFTVHVGERPGLLFDYYGFPKHTYDLHWDAPAAPDVARRTGQLLQQAGIHVGEEAERGWDHGVFIPMMVALPRLTFLSRNCRSACLTGMPITTPRCTSGRGRRWRRCATRMC